MVIPAPLLHRTFRITVDIEATVNAMPRDLANSPEESLHFHHTLVQHLLTHPKLLEHLLRASAVEEFRRAEKMLAREYGWDRLSDQQVLQAVIAELEPAAQAYFLEEIEDGISVYSFDGYEATVKQFHLVELEEK